jgi:hypothetical protein
VLGVSGADWSWRPVREPTPVSKNKELALPVP